MKIVKGRIKFTGELAPDLDLIIKHLGTCRDFDNLILKGHLLIEHLLNEYILSESKEKIDLKKMNFTFYQKLNICKILGLFSLNKTIYKSIERLNSLRNSVTHRLEYDKDILSKFIEFTYNRFPNPEIFVGESLYGKEFSQFYISILILYSEIKTSSVALKEYWSKISVNK